MKVISTTDDTRASFRPVPQVRDGWPTQARVWLEWGSSMAGQSVAAVLRAFVPSFRLDLVPSLTVAGCGQQHPHSKFRKEREI